MIPANCTAYLQTLDVSINRSFKSRMSDKIEEYMYFNDNWSNGKLKKFSIELMTGWIKEILSSFSQTQINKALESGGLPTEYTTDWGPEDTYLAKHERLGEGFIAAYYESLANVCITEIVSKSKQFEADELGDETFHVNLYNFDPDAERATLRTRTSVDPLTKTRSECEARAYEILDRASPSELTDKVCVFCNVEMLSTQNHVCDKCLQPVHGFGIGCMSRSDICLNCANE
eukprot:NODE_399_length_8099_cov_0.731375.p4 type:complete len:231 gc:universal NODE_399_length_8099_cov_0.731375:7527-6835(-)